MLAAGCAETKMVMEFSKPVGLTMPKVWPEPPDEPRYQYVGELTGENNFHAENWEDRNTARKVFDWLVGLTERNPLPVMLQRPQSGMVDSAGRIFVTDMNRGAVYVFDKLAGRLDIWANVGASERLVSPVGIVQGARGEILVADAELHSVIRYDNKGEPVGEFGRDILKRPTGLARDSLRGHIYVADTHAHEIKVFDDEGNFLKAIGQRGEEDGQLNFPTHLVFAKDKLYVTDTLNARVQIFDAEGKMTGKFGKRGLQVGNMVRPKGVAVDSRGNIYVIESLHDNLLVFDDQGRTLMAIGGNGKNAGEFNLPAGVWIDEQDQVYVADMFNGRVSVLQFLGREQ